jgi:hypothetical protein
VQQVGKYYFGSTRANEPLTLTLSRRERGSEVAGFWELVLRIMQNGSLAVPCEIKALPLFLAFRQQKFFDL